MLIKHRFALALIGMALPAPGMPQVIKLPDGEAQVVVPRDAPSRGMAKSQVERRYGEPRNRAPAVGNPPSHDGTIPIIPFTSKAIWCCTLSLTTSVKRKFRRYEPLQARFRGPVALSALYNAGGNSSTVV